MAGRTIAIFTDQADLTADAVVVELRARRVPIFRCDPAEFPASLTMVAHLEDRWSGRLSTPTRTLDLTEVGCAWWRRPSPIAAPDGVAEQAWSDREADAGFRGLTACLSWLNHPDDIRAAAHIPLQLTVAAQAGLQVPPTILTNDPAEVRAFTRFQGNVIYKPLTRTPLTDGKVIHPSSVEPDDVDDSVSMTAHLFQYAVPTAYRLRVLVIDGHVFAMRIDTGADRVTYRPAAVPPAEKGRIRTFAMRLRLRVAAIDMVVTPTGEYVFLDIAPDTDWAWIEHETGLPLATAIADALEATAAA
jgi:hypothetical protein